MDLLQHLHPSLRSSPTLSSVLLLMFGAMMIGTGDLTMGSWIAVSMLAAAPSPRRPRSLRWSLR